MNRDGVHAASVAGGLGRPLVFVSPRPASDPGDGSGSDLGSDAEYADVMGSNTDGGGEGGGGGGGGEAVDAADAAEGGEGSSGVVVAEVGFERMWVGDGGGGGDGGGTQEAADDDDADAIGMISVLGRYRGVARNPPPREGHGIPPSPFEPQRRDSPSAAVAPPAALPPLTFGCPLPPLPPVAEYPPTLGGSEEPSLARRMSSSSQPGQRSRGAVTPLQHAALRPVGPGSATHLRLPPTLSHQPLSPPQWQSPLAGGVVLAAGLPGNDGAAAAAYAQAVLLPEQQQRVLLGSLARSSDAGDRGSSPEHWALAGAGPVLRASVTSSEASAHYRAQSVPGTPDMALPFRDAADGASTFARSRSGSMAGGAAAIQLTPNSSVLKSPFASIGASPLFAEPLPATKELTFLECVVELLKGTKCLKRKNLLQVNDGRIWLAADMSAVRYRYIPRRGPAVEDEFEVAKVRKIKSTDREISIVVDEKKTVEFILSSREKACVWLSGLCCLVPPRATVKTKYKHVTEHRENYDPLRDSWNGKPLIQRKWFKQYILLGSIGRGAFGKVKLALSRTDRRFYAVKVLSKAMMRKQNRNSAFDRVSHQDSSLSTGFNSDSDAAADVQEVTVMRNLDHPNVVKLVDTHDDVENDRLFIVLEYVALGPVMNSSKLTGATPMDRSTVRPIFIDALAGLMYLHSRGVVHRDFKPENLLLAGDETAKISDFGSAHAYDDAAADAAAAVVNPHRAAVGTPAFTAPELCMSEKSPPAPPVPYAADIWSLGVTLFYMWYGQAPFLAKSVFEMYDAICTQTLEFPKSREAPASLRNLLTSMLEKIPSKRATFAVILQSPWLSEGAHGKSLKRIVDLREQAIR